jgi:hypothetical protein
VSLVLQTVVSYRSVPRILNLFNTKTSLLLNWVPHFTSVINWTLRLGLGMLFKVQPISKSWVAIIDHSIAIGTKKVLVVLRVNMDSLSRRSKAITLEDCECIGVKVSEKVNGETIAVELKEIFTHAGIPKAIIKDCDSTLQKGVNLWLEEQDSTILVIDDIGHVMASVFKSQFEKTNTYKRLTSLVEKCAKRLRQTDLAFLTPPKLRTKGRFLSMSKLGKWAEKIIEIMAVKGGAKKGSLLERLRKVLPTLGLLKPFIIRFANFAKIAAQIMEILKNKGLDKTTYQQCNQLLQQLPNSKVKTRLRIWLQKHIQIQSQIGSQPLLVSSDIIESLFGNFKHVIERSPQADMNRTVLLIPALCGKLEHTTITSALRQTPHHKIKIWEQENISYTVRKKRQAFFENNEIQKPGKYQIK